ncbi:MAG: NAD(P)/FAD-dependent oxidoreductase [Balneola sp.]
MSKTLYSSNIMNQFDVIIIGGSYAGLSAAMALGRSLKKTLIIDAGKPCNRQTPHSHNFLTRDGETPKAISAIALEQVMKYESVSFKKGTVVSGSRTNSGYEIVTSNKDVFSTKKLILATGIKDEMPDIPGFAESWGISVIHCPYCHGYEFKTKKTGIFANGDQAFHLAGLVSNLTNELTILTNGDHEFTDEQIAKLEQHSISIVESKLLEIVHQKGAMLRIVFKDGNALDLDAMYAHVPFTHHIDLSSKLGYKYTEQGYIEIDAFQKTTVPNIFACGDNSSRMRSVANAVSTGNFAGAMANMELTNENF